MGFLDRFRLDSARRFTEEGSARLEAAIEAVAASPSPAATRELHEALLASTLFLGVQQVPSGISETPSALEEDTPVSVLTSTNPVGATVLLAFTSPQQLAARNPALPWIALAAPEVLEMAAAGDGDGLVINPNGTRLDLSSRQVAALVKHS